MAAGVAPSVPRRVVVVVALAVGLLGAAVRLWMLFRPSPLFFGVYDDGVHFSAALNLVHGHWPYRDVLFLQPPGIIVAATPFALLANVVGDANAFAGARIVFALLGGLNGALVAVALRRFGVGAMLVGGALYALSFAAAYDERTVTLEVIGTTGILASLVLLDVAASRRRRLLVLLAGVAAGIAVDFKIWYVVPFVVLAVVARRGAPRFVLGGVVAVLVGYLPFFVVAPAQMWQQVVAAQLGRPALKGSPIDDRLRSMLGIAQDDSTGRIPALLGPSALGVLLALAILLALVALLFRGARRFVALLAACAVVLLASPSYFQHYAVLTAAPLALVAGVGTAELARRVGRNRPAVLAVSVAVALALQLGVSARQDVMRSNQKVAPVAALRAASARIDGCIVADDPTILILMNRLTPELRAGCVVRSDPSGYGYVLTNAVGEHVSRTRNPVWQRNALAYLRGADAYLLVRGTMFGLTPASEATVAGDRVLSGQGRFVIRTAR